MASGYGLNGGPSRCFPFWQEVLACYVVNTSTENDAGKKLCAPHARAMAIQAAYHKAEQANPRDDAPKAGVVRNLGLLGKDEDTKKVLGLK
ncbi:hypothetical protein DSL72_000044 [Monilinia vaccinii-corymbosi]|uniref:Uncharacterized protein n=1 Tax=Monilinia vaccinii-corymbosi TaxID=61207 RepID=A0A8A3P1Y7_9HELO|nr:hypothetical protein DSL72_000044 [Monilinia vaccinii-corymbosi]